MKTFAIIKDGETNRLELSDEQFNQVRTYALRQIMKTLEDRKTRFSKEIEKKQNPKISHRLRELEKVIEIINGVANKPLA